MTVGITRPPVLVVSASWQGPDTELSFVTRAVAGAASRGSEVTVVTPSPAGEVVPDGAFDLRGIGRGGEEGWPDPREAQWGPPPPPGSTWLFDEAGQAALALFEAFGGGSTAFSVTPVNGDAVRDVRHMPFVPARDIGPSEELGMYVPVNPLAATYRHGGLGFTGYLLVLTDRPSRPAITPPTPDAAWLTARFYGRDVVVIEGGRAAVWKGRALRGIVGVDTRIDLWRLMAHAWVTIDLAPGDIIARECVESLRFGTPIVVPSATAGAAHAHAGGGFTFSGTPELLESVEQLLDASERERCSHRGAEYADSRYGDPDAFVAGVARFLDLVRG
jgi:hypothetical protein